MFGHAGPTPEFVMRTGAYALMDPINARQNVSAGFINNWTAKAVGRTPSLVGDVRNVPPPVPEGPILPPQPATPLSPFPAAPAVAASTMEGFFGMGFGAPRRVTRGSSPFSRPRTAGAGKFPGATPEQRARWTAENQAARASMSPKDYFKWMVAKRKERRAETKTALSGYFGGYLGEADAASAEAAADAGSAEAEAVAAETVAPAVETTPAGRRLLGMDGKTFALVAGFAGLLGVVGGTLGAGPHRRATGGVTGAITGLGAGLGAIWLSQR